MYSRNYDTSINEYYAGAGENINKPQNTFFFVLLAATIIITALGLLNLYSASHSMQGVFSTQIRHVGVTFFVAAIVGWAIPIKYVNHYAYHIFFMTIALLVVVIILGHTSNGSQRWIRIGPIGIQPSELAKISLAIGIAKFFSDNSGTATYGLRDLLPVTVMIGLVFALIFIQPDFGTAGICLIVAASQLSFIRIRLKSILMVVATGLVLAPIGWNVLLHDYQRNRVLMLLNPDLDPHGKGYNSIQSLVAIGSGQGMGKGFLQGTQTQLQFLPARHTDFVFSVFAEEHGFWLGLTLFALYAILTLAILIISRSAKDTFGSLVCLGIAGLIFSQFFINIAMVLGIFPVVGMTLPFFSFGGSSLLTLGIGLGLVIGVHRQRFATKKV